MMLLIKVLACTIAPVKHSYYMSTAISITFTTDISDESHFVFLNQAMHKTVHSLFLKSDPKAWRKRVLALIRILKDMEKINSAN